MCVTADYVVSSRKPVIARACGYARLKNNTKITLLRGWGGLLEAKTVGVDMELEDKENGDVIEERISWAGPFSVELNLSE